MGRRRNRLQRIEARVTEHLTDRQIESYQDRTIRAAELVSLDRHVAVCAECRRRLSAVVQEEKFLSLKKALDSEPDDQHLDYEHLAAYVDGLLADEEVEITESHLAVCQKCHLMASDLSVFKDEVAPDLNKVYAPPAALPHSPKVWERLTEFLHSVLSFRSPAMTVGFGTTLLLLIGVAVWLVLRSNLPENRPPHEVAQNPGSTPTVTPTPASSPQDDNTPSPTPTPEATPEALLALNDGSRRIAIDEQGNLTGLDELSPAHRQAVKNGLATQQVVNPSALAGVSGKPGALRGESNGSAFAPLNPLGKVILTTHPTFSWSRLDGATAYKVVVYDSTFNPVSSSPQLTTTSWATTHALKRGEIYSWQVIATKDGQEVKVPVPPASEAKFKVLEQGGANELDRARRSYGNSHLALGVLYAQAGLLDEAEREFSLLLKANPNSDVVRNLLRNVRMMRRAR